MSSLGNFWKFLVIKLLAKVSQKIGNFFGQFYKTSLLCKSGFGYFSGIFGNTWAIFAPTSGRTVLESPTLIDPQQIVFPTNSLSNIHIKYHHFSSDSCSSLLSSKFHFLYQNVNIFTQIRLKICFYLMLTTKNNSSSQIFPEVARIEANNKNF